MTKIYILLGNIPIYREAKAFRMLKIHNRKSICTKCTKKLIKELFWYKMLTNRYGTVFIFLNINSQNVIIYSFGKGNRVNV